MLDDDQGVEAPQQHGVHVDEVDRENAAGLRGQELLPGRARAAGRGVDPGVVQDLPHRGGGDRVAEPDEFALHAPVPPRRILRRHADHELADRGCRGRPPGTPPAGVVPFACDQPPVPGEQRRRGHREHLAPPAAGDQPRQCREPQPVARLVADPADLAAQHRVLVPQHQEFGILGHLTPGQHHQAAEQATHEQVDDRKDHSAMIPARQAAQARSSNRAPQAEPRPTTTDDGPIAAVGFALPGPTTPWPACPSSGSDACPSLAASSTNTSGPPKSPAQDQWQSFGTPQASGDVSGNHLSRGRSALLRSRLNNPHRKACKHPTEHTHCQETADRLSASLVYFAILMTGRCCLCGSSDAKIHGHIGVISLQYG